jgi:hypothetical protein
MSNDGNLSNPTYTPRFLKPPPPVIFQWQKFQRKIKSQEMKRH